MSELSDAFIATIGRPDAKTAPGIQFADPVDIAVWSQIYADIGSGWYMNRFLYLLGEGLDTLQQCIEAWSFLVPPDRQWTIIGKNAYGSLLLAQDLATQGFVCSIHVLDTLNVRLWTNPNLVFTNLLGYWLPERKLGDFLDTRLYDAWHQATGDYLELHEILAIKEPKSLGGKMVASNFQIEDI